VRKRSKLLTNNAARYLASFLLVLACGEVLALSTFVPLDDAVHNWIEVHRSCTGTRLFLSEWPLVSLIALGAFTLLWLCQQQRWTEGTHGGAVIILGGFLVELLKTAFERARPNTLPPLFTGNSFPSGHTVGALLLAGTLGYFLLQQRTAAWKKGVGVIVLLVCVAAVMWQRLYLMHHWLSDIVGSVLLASAWLCFALVRPAGRSVVRHFAPACVGLLLGYPLFYYFPAIRMTLPSVMTSTREPLLALSFGDVNSTVVFQGSWGGQSHEPAGPVTWMHYGEASLDVQLPHRQAYTVQFAVRPSLALRGETCFPLEISMNQQLVQRFLLQRGWRQYELRLDPSLIQVGLNTLTFRTGASTTAPAAPQEAVAFRTLALFAERQ
jgi:membrane-associated phospholipid phosphatase